MIVVGGSTSRDLAKDIASIIGCKYIEAATVRFLTVSVTQGSKKRHWMTMSQSFRTHILMRISWRCSSSRMR